jgi:hypothetical protein
MRKALQICEAELSNPFKTVRPLPKGLRGHQYLKVHRHRCLRQFNSLRVSLGTAIALSTDRYAEAAILMKFAARKN